MANLLLFAFGSRNRILIKLNRIVIFYALFLSRTFYTTSTECSDSVYEV